ncbi:hypothetical protein [Dyadobacter sp. 50-39]|uniref:hypothetical protein n=1 Tax=Dyadobacter sp. 50-39 TaxID=1895756 RepID=UPI0025B9B5A8|nr:hypothetical protein [Dyadobacter sp. 50-39]
MVTRFRRIAFILMALLPGLNVFAQNTKYNVLFIAVDDMNDWIGPFGGYPGIQ